MASMSVSVAAQGDPETTEQAPAQRVSREDLLSGR